MTWSQPGLREAFLLSWVSLALTIVAFVAGLAVAATSASSATLGFALENAVDFVSSALVCWRFQGGGTTVPEERLAQREKRASVGIALAFVALAFVVGGVASSHLSTHEVPTNIGVLVGLAAPSAVIFGTLGALKWWVGVATASASMKKDAACSLCGATLSLGVCFGAAASANSNKSVWWLDAVIALLVCVGMLVFGCYSLIKAARDGNQWWTWSFWSKGGRPGSPMRVIEALPPRLEEGGSQPGAMNVV